MICAITMATVIILIILIGKLVDRAEEKSEKWLWWAKPNYEEPPEEEGKAIKILKQISIIIIALALGFLIGWRMTVTKGAIEIDKANNHIGYFTVFGQTDEYYID